VVGLRTYQHPCRIWGPQYIGSSTPSFCAAKRKFQYPPTPPFLLFLKACVRKEIQVANLTFRGPCIVIYSYNKANKMHCFSNLFDKEIYMFWTGLLFIVRSLNTVFTEIGICHTSYVDCLLAWSGWSSILTTLAVNITTMTNAYCCVYSVEILLMMDSKTVRNM